MASGDSLLTIDPRMNTPPTTLYAIPDTRNTQPTLRFDTTTAWAAVFREILPRNYASGGITVYVHWAATSATTGTIGWTVEFERIGNVQDTDADNFATPQTITAATVNAASGIVTVTSVAVANGAAMGSIAPGELFRLRIKRDVANDNAAGDAEIHGVHLVES